VRNVEGEKRKVQRLLCSYVKRVRKTRGIGGNATDTFGEVAGGAKNLSQKLMNKTEYLAPKRKENKTDYPNASEQRQTQVIIPTRLQRM